MSETEQKELLVLCFKALAKLKKLEARKTVAFLGENIVDNRQYVGFNFAKNRIFAFLLED